MMRDLFSMNEIHNNTLQLLEVLEPQEFATRPTLSQIIAEYPITNGNWEAATRKDCYHNHRGPGRAKTLEEALKRVVSSHWETDPMPPPNCPPFSIIEEWIVRGPIINAILPQYCCLDPWNRNFENNPVLAAMGLTTPIRITYNKRSIATIRWTTVNKQAVCCVELGSTVIASPWLFGISNK